MLKQQGKMSKGQAFVR